MILINYLRVKAQDPDIISMIYSILKNNKRNHEKIIYKIILLKKKDFIVYQNLGHI